MCYLRKNIASPLGSDSSRWAFVFRDKAAPFLQVWEGHLSRVSQTSCRVRSESYPCTCLFSGSSAGNIQYGEVPYFRVACPKLC